MATGNIFKKKFGVDPNVFKSVNDVDNFLKKKIELNIKRVHSGVASTRGSIFPIVKIDANRKFDQAINA